MLFLDDFLSTRWMDLIQPPEPLDNVPMTAPGATFGALRYEAQMDQRPLGPTELLKHVVQVRLIR